MKIKKILNGVICVSLAAIFGIATGCSPKPAEKIEKGEKISFAMLDTSSSSENAVPEEKWVTKERKE